MFIDDLLYTVQMAFATGQGQATLYISKFKTKIWQDITINW